MGRRARASRDQILRAAREAFSERGFDGTTLAAIGARVGLSPSALLRHAPTTPSLDRPLVRSLALPPSPLSSAG